MKTRICIYCLFILFLLTACTPTEKISRNDCKVGSIPETLSFDPFYEKYCDADGIHIISSADVDNLALQQAYYIVMNMLHPIPHVRDEMVSNGAYFAVIGIDENLTDLPEYSHMDSDYWNWRARGLGAGREMKITSTAEENLLCLPNDRWYGESIAVHEFAHSISTLGIGEYDFGQLFAEFNVIYLKATEKGLWEQTYAGSNIQEYWAEGVQNYFNTNVESIPTDGVHNYVNTRKELERYDPDLYNFIDTFFYGYAWTPSCP